MCMYKTSDYTFIFKIYENRKDLLVKMQVNSVTLCYFPAGISKIKTCKWKGSRKGN